MKKNKKEHRGIKEIWNLFFSFFKIGLFTIGGGMAMIPLIEKVAVKDKKWLTEEEMLDCLAVGQGLPGIIAVNTATYIGNKTRGFPGAFFATLGVILPSFIIILLLATVLNKVGDRDAVQGALVGIKAAVCGLLIVVTYRMMRRSLKSVFPWIIFALTFVTVGFFKVTAIWAILAAALAGIVYYSIRERRRES
ncbi:MAG: chromate transporter [Anaerovoracaceae bacterium]|jgi:chromate transporter